MGRQILLLGIGQTGCAVADGFARRMRESGEDCIAIAMDTDVRSLSDIRYAEALPVISEKNLASTVEDLDPESLRTWFPCDWEKDHSEFIKNLDMKTGANQWRMKAFLAFTAFISDKDKQRSLEAMLQNAVEACSEGGELALYVVAALGGGTGSGLFLPVTLYVRRLLSELGAKVASSNAILAMPSVYENIFSAEQGVKSRANAYAALRELNAVDLAVSKDASDTASEHPPIGFRLGDKKGTPTLLFDSERKEYRTKEAAPFHKVVLFERVPGVTSLQSHIDILTDVLASLAVYRIEASDPIIPSNANAVTYAGISLSKVKYEKDSILQYISMKQLCTLVCEELCRPHIAAREAARREAYLEQEASGRAVSDIAAYADAYIGHAAEASANGGISALLGRPVDMQTGDPLTERIWDDGYEKELYEAVKSTFLCDASDALLRETVGSLLTEGEKRISARERRCRLAALGEECGTRLREYYRHCRESLTAGRTAFATQILCGSGDGGFSITESILKADGGFLHPALALVRLCSLYRAVAARIDKSLAYTAEELPEDKPPYFMLRVATKGRSRTAYAREEEHRFSLLVGEGFADAPLKAPVQADEAEENTEAEAVPQDKAAKKKKSRREKQKAAALARLPVEPEHIADDEDAFRFDLEGVYNGMTRYFCALRYGDILELVSDLIDRYRLILDSLSRASEDLRADLRLSLLRASRENANVSYVATSTEEKEAVCRAYLEAYRKDGAAVLADDAAIGADFHAVLLSPDVETGREVLSERLRAVFAASCRSSHFYKEKVEKNVLRAAFDSMNGVFGGSELSLGRLFGEKYAPVRMGGGGMYEAQRRIRQTSVVILPKSVGEYITEHSEELNATSPKSFVEKLMYDVGEYKSEAVFVDGIPDDTLFIQREISDFPLSLVESLDELGADGTDYSAYRKARRLMREQVTQMWNPDLVYRRDASAPLPMISRRAQDAYETAVAKAVLISVMNGEILLRDVADVGRVYCYQSGHGILPITVDGDTVSDRRTRLIFAWAYANPEWTEAHAEKYDLAMRSLPRLAAAEQMGGLGLTALAIRATQPLCDAMSLLLLRLFAGKAQNDSGYARRVAETVNATLLSYCKNGADRLMEETGHIYNSLLSAFVERTVGTSGAQRTEGLVMWLNSQKTFMRYLPPHSFCNYTF